MLAVEHHKRARERKDKHAKREHLAMLVVRTAQWIREAKQPALVVWIGAVPRINAALRPATERGLRCAHAHRPRVATISKRRVSAVSSAVVLKAATLTCQGLGLRRCGLRLVDG
jgi:hypothetical protein